MPERNTYDVIIMGGGLAGLCIGLQLSRRHEDMQILIAERRAHPAPEVGFKVGESTVEMAAHYFGDILGMKQHLSEAQLPKPGLRFYFSDGKNTDIAQRTEVGHSFWPKYITYQLDRGRFENALREACVEAGITFLDQSKVRDITISEDQEPHTVMIERNGSTSTYQSRWLIDASGRPGVIKRRLNLAKPSNHNTNAVWFRVHHNIDIDTWSDDADWLERAPRNLRRFATNHLMGKGYWVWLIPLASDATSVGIVTDATLHNHEDLNSFEKALQWLHEHEPQCAAIVEEHADELADFRVLRHYAHDCERVYSPQRWCITGEAGVFPDPFYSPGSDLIAFSNLLVGDLIAHDRAGEDITELAEAYNGFFLGQWSSTLALFEGQYPIFGHPQAMTAKIMWDSTNYWGISGLLFYQNKLTDLPFLGSVLEPLIRQDTLIRNMQAFFRAWAEVDPVERVPTFVDQYKVSYLYDLHKDMGTAYDEDSLRARIEANVRLIEMVAVSIVEQAKPFLPPELIASTAEWLPQVEADPAIVAGIESIWMEAAPQLA